MKGLVRGRDVPRPRLGHSGDVAKLSMTPAASDVPSCITSGNLTNPAASCAPPERWGCCFQGNWDRQTEGRLPAAFSGNQQERGATNPVIDTAHSPGDSDAPWRPAGLGGEASFTSSDQRHRNSRDHPSTQLPHATRSAWCRQVRREDGQGRWELTTESTRRRAWRNMGTGRRRRSVSRRSRTRAFATPAITN